MSSKIRVGIAGYGNLGRGVELALAQNPDMELVSVFTRRDPASLRLQSAGVPVRALDQIEQYRNDIDVLILCGGSKNDLPEQGPALARWFTTVDSFDTHARIPEYYEAVDAAAVLHGVAPAQRADLEAVAVPRARAVLQRVRRRHLRE